MQRSYAPNLKKPSSFLRDRAGNVSILFAATLPLIVAGAGFATEGGYWFYRSLGLQAASDAAAYAAALEKLAGSPIATIKSEAVKVAVQNEYDATAGTAIVHSPPATGPNTGKNGVEVVLQQTLPRFFSQIFDERPFIITRRAVAIYAVDTKACMLALDPSASRTVLVSGSADVKLVGCSIMANSIANDAIRTQGSALIAADCLVSAGGLDLSANSVTTKCAAPVTKASPVNDPFADLPAPSTGGPCQPATGGVLQAGTYCNGLTLSGTIALKPGVYVISGGNFNIASNAKVTGSDVVFYLTGGARATINGSATVQLSAPQTGTYKGVLFYGDRSSTGGINKFNGTAASLLTGAIYFAKQNVEYTGDFSGIGGCTQIVANTISWSGKAQVKQDCSSLGLRDIPASQIVKLVE